MRGAAKHATGQAGLAFGRPHAQRAPTGALKGDTSQVRGRGRSPRAGVDSPAAIATPRVNVAQKAGATRAPRPAALGAAASSPATKRLAAAATNEPPRPAERAGATHPVPVTKQRTAATQRVVVPSCPTAGTPCYEDQFLPALRGTRHTPYAACPVARHALGSTLAPWLAAVRYFQYRLTPHTEFLLTRTRRCPSRLPYVGWSSGRPSCTGTGSSRRGSDSRRRSKSSFSCRRGYRRCGGRTQRGRSAACSVSCSGWRTPRGSGR